MNTQTTATSLREITEQRIRELGQAAVDAAAEELAAIRRIYASETEQDADWEAGEQAAVRRDTALLELLHMGSVVFLGTTDERSNLIAVAVTSRTAPRTCRLVELSAPDHMGLRQAELLADHLNDLGVDQLVRTFEAGGYPGYTEQAEAPEAVDDNWRDVLGNEIAAREAVALASDSVREGSLQDLADWLQLQGAHLAGKRNWYAMARRLAEEATM